MFFIFFIIDKVARRVICKVRVREREFSLERKDTNRIKGDVEERA